MTDLERLITHVQATISSPVSTEGAQAFADEVYGLAAQVLPATQLTQLRGTPPPAIESLIPDPSNESPFYGAPFLAAAILTLDWRARPERREAGRALVMTSVHRATSGPLGAALILSDPTGQGVGTRLNEAPAPHERGWPLTLRDTGQHTGTSITLVHVAGAWTWLSEAGVPVPSPRIIRDWMARSPDLSDSMTEETHRWIMVNLWEQLSQVRPSAALHAALDRWSQAVRPPVGAEISVRLTLAEHRSAGDLSPLPPRLRGREFLQLPKVAQTLLQKASHPLAVTGRSRRADDQLTVAPPGTLASRPRAAVTDLGPALERAEKAVRATWAELKVTKASQVQHALTAAQTTVPRGGLTQTILMAAPAIFGASVRLSERPELQAHAPHDITRALIQLAADLEEWVPKGNWHPERVWPAFAQGKGGASQVVTRRLQHFGPPTPELLCLAALIGLRQQAYYGTYSGQAPLALRLTLSMVATRALERASKAVSALTPTGRRLESYVQPQGSGWVSTHQMMLDMSRPFMQSVSETELAGLIGPVQ